MVVYKELGGGFRVSKLTSEPGKGSYLEKFARRVAFYYFFCYALKGIALS